MPTGLSTAQNRKGSSIVGCRCTPSSSSAHHSHWLGFMSDSMPSRPLPWFITFTVHRCDILEPSACSPSTSPTSESSELQLVICIHIMAMISAGTRSWLGAMFHGLFPVYLVSRLLHFIVLLKRQERNASFFHSTY